ncbi:hypothetical protein ALC62_03561 [Cyphomyrmex costatus]|uniref:Uncharacterized protein n=1 Tax=Cyphomyrmex costatus TaxID=456900 RepID=A0A151ILA2_9HYME|nr:hypothetical protein ALC62_03561 [Cyphomyrmex costatus]
MPGCAAVNCSNRVDKGYRLFSFPKGKINGLTICDEISGHRPSLRDCVRYILKIPNSKLTALMAGENLNRMQSQRFSMCPTPRTNRDENATPAQIAIIVNSFDRSVLQELNSVNQEKATEECDKPFETTQQPERVFDLHTPVTDATET